MTLILTLYITLDRNIDLEMLPHLKNEGEGRRLPRVKNIPFFLTNSTCHEIKKFSQKNKKVKYSFSRVLEFCPLIRTFEGVKNVSF